jgi:sortase A
MSKQFLYKQPWYTGDVPSKRQLGRACKVCCARSAAWLRRPLQPSELLRETKLRWLRNPRKSALRAAEVCLWVVAVASLGFCSIAYGGAAIHQAREKAILASLRANGGAHAQLGTGLRASSLRPANEVLLGLIEIPRLDTAAIVEEGVSTGTLWKAVGHIPGTAFPGESGNAVLAAHRDTYFSGLGDVKIGDLVSFKSPTATYSYRVESARVVEPDDDSVLRASKDATLTLITCYPFHYIGSAPQRYVVTAREVPMSPSE